MFLCTCCATSNTLARYSTTIRLYIPYLVPCGLWHNRQNTRIPIDHVFVRMCVLCVAAYVWWSHYTRCSCCRCFLAFLQNLSTQQVVSSPIVFSSSCCQHYSVKYNRTNCCTYDISIYWWSTTVSYTHLTLPTNREG